MKCVKGEVFLKIQKKAAVILAALCFALVAGCSAGGESSLSEGAVSQGGSPQTVSSQEVVSSQESQTSSPGPEDLSSSGGADPVKEKEAVLYIGSDGRFQEYTWKYERELTPDALIQAISDLTGWDLTLADAVTVGKGGMTVCFSKESALFIGPPDPQKEDFFMFDAESLDRTILDSIQHTLQYNFVDPELGDPDSLDIYYCMEGNAPLTLPGINVTLPMDQPYKGFTVE